MPMQQRSDGGCGLKLLVTARALQTSRRDRQCLFGYSKPRLNRCRATFGCAIFGMSDTFRHCRENVSPLWSVGIASHQLHHGPSSFARTTQPMATSSQLFGYAVTGCKKYRRNERRESRRSSAIISAPVNQLTREDGHAARGAL